MKLLAWLKDNNPFTLAERNRLALDQLQRHGLTTSDRRLFEMCCRTGQRTPPGLADRVIAAADAARMAGEEQVA